MTNNNLYVSLEELEKRLLGKFDYKIQYIIENQIYSIPTIDPITTIDEMIEEERSNTVEVILTKLKTRLFPKQ